MYKYFVTRNGVEREVTDRNSAMQKWKPVFMVLTIIKSP